MDSLKFNQQQITSKSTFTKKLKGKMIIFLVIALLLSLSSCSSDDNENDIQDTFLGNYIGGYNEDPNSTELSFLNFKMNFNTDGTLHVTDTGGNEADGNWTQIDNEITSVYSYNNGESFFTVKTDLTFIDNVTYLIGYWSSGEMLSDPATGYLKLTLEE
ncbi:hypothetical protein [uncultured Winogradskyella sp.]|uniref:hypothetical protein n=1 Tax=uncultured Winogradskyella sp. TaxID=395353 RepID=UPI00260E0B9B|nr:hypothetical protein [uncultured Winogradskyella sp.]